MLSANDSMNAAATPGVIIGIVIFQNVRIGGEPRSIAASSSVQSIPRMRALTVIATKLRQNNVCEITIVQKPAADTLIEEQGEQRGTHHDLGRGERQHQEQIDGRTAAHSVAHERERDAGCPGRSPARRRSPPP